MAAKKKGLTQDAMQAFIQKTMTSLGAPPIKFEPDEDLRYFWQGKPLTIGELKRLPENAVVWVTYKKYGHDGGGFRINHAMRVSREEGADAWFLVDGSSFAAEFTPAAGLTDGDDCFDDCIGEGEMFLYHAEKLTPAEHKKRVTAQKKLLKALDDISKGGKAAKRGMSALKPKRRKGRR